MSFDPKGCDNGDEYSVESHPQRGLLANILGVFILASGNYWLLVVETSLGCQWSTSIMARAKEDTMLPCAEQSNHWNHR